MHKLTVLSALFTLVLSTFLITACDDAKNNVAAPTTFDVGGVSASVTADSPVPDTNAGNACAAFTIPLSVVVQTGSAAVTITSVSAQFVPSSGMPMPQVTLPAPAPTVQFGTALTEAQSVQTIPLLLPIGCAVDHTGTVVVLVGTRDGRGNSNTTRVSGPVGRPGNRPGNNPGNAPGNTPGNTPGNAPGNRPGNRPGNTPGNTPGNAPAR
jgi:hypothetical protein